MPGELGPDGGPFGAPDAAPDSERWSAADAVAPAPDEVPFAVGVAPDLQGQAQSRVISQYRNAANLKAEIAGNVAILQAICNALVQIPPLDDPAIAGGVNLTVTGELVGQARQLPNGTIASDIMMRLLIACRIARNVAHGTGPEVIAQLMRIFPGVEVRFEDTGGMLFTFAIGRHPTYDEVSIVRDLDMLPRPAGVGMVMGWYQPGFFGFSDTPGALGFGDIDNTSGPGGAFAEQVF